ncbi:MAG: hypothetical protein FWC33_06070 [Candidatus Bathyarchaeota archaeon]|nr:hypothetical protein [Candidatus Termiticorpusculum sp.]
MGGKCYTWRSHKFYRYKEIQHRNSKRKIAVQVKLEKPQDTDFCINCGLQRQDIMKTKPKKKTTTTKTKRERRVIK